MSDLKPAPFDTLVLRRTMPNGEISEVAFPGTLDPEVSTAVFTPHVTDEDEYNPRLTGYSIQINASTRDLVEGEAVMTWKTVRSPGDRT